MVGPYPVIREELRARGWVERTLSSTAQRAHRCHGNEMDCSGDDERLRAGETVFRTLREILIIIKHQDIFNRRLFSWIMSDYVCRFEALKERDDGAVKVEKTDDLQSLMVNSTLSELTSPYTSTTCS